MRVPKKKGREEGIEKGIEIGAREKSLQMAKALIKKGVMKIEEIMQVTGLSMEDISKIQNGK